MDLKFTNGRAEWSFSFFSIYSMYINNNIALREDNYMKFYIESAYERLNLYEDILKNYKYEKENHMNELDKEIVRHAISIRTLQELQQLAREIKNTCSKYDYLHCGDLILDFEEREQTLTIYDDYVD
jgi:hypothetical protein